MAIVFSSWPPAGRSGWPPTLRAVEPLGDDRPRERPNGFQEHARFVVHHASYLDVQRLGSVRRTRSSRVYPMKAAIALSSPCHRARACLPAPASGPGCAAPFPHRTDCCRPIRRSAGVKSRLACTFTRHFDLCWLRSHRLLTPQRRRITIRRQSGGGPLQFPWSSVTWRPGAG